MKMIPVLSVLLLVASVCGAAEEKAPDLKDLPANTWVTLPTDPRAGYVWGPLVFDPGRGQLLHWGRIARNKAAQTNDVRAFDADKGVWVSDYPSAPSREIGIARQKKGIGVWTGGVAAMLSNGAPAPSAVVHAACYDTKRKRIVYTLPGMMAAYDPATKKWSDLKAKTIISDRTYPGGPPVYGAGTGYDPVNDEIVLFPHWKARNIDRRDVDGRMSAHWGTFRYTFEDNTWRRVGRWTGPERLRSMRNSFTSQFRGASRAVDAIWALRRRPDAEPVRSIAGQLRDAIDCTRGAARLDPAKSYLEKARAFLESTYKARMVGKWDDALRSGGMAMWYVNELLDRSTRVEPPPRAATPMVYDPKSKRLVMHGGHDGLVRTDLRGGSRSPSPPGRNDTWLYDCKTKQWREIAKDRRPPTTGRNAYLFHDPHSGLIIRVIRPGFYARGKARAVTIWGLDVAKGEWSLLHTAPWTGKAGLWYTVGYDPKRQLIVLVQSDRYTWKQCIQGMETRVFKLDVSKLTPTPAPVYKAPPEIKPHAIPADDAKIIAKLKALPANKWIHTRPPRDADTRDWGISACDRLRGEVYYFGGGHSTYQANDVAIYQPGANKWAFHVGDHNDWVPVTGWGGVFMGFMGGGHAHHMRNAYVAVDGRMYITTGAVSRRWGAKSGFNPGPRYCWFYDVDRGGVWRQLKVTVKKSDPKIGVFGGTHMATPDGRVIGFGGTLEPYDGRFFKNEAYFNSLDIYTNELTIKKIPQPHPGHVYEYRPFCFLPKRNQVFFYEIVIDRKTKKPERERTWVYDIKTNKFTDLKPKQQPGVQITTVENIVGQSAVMAVTQNTQWVYSFEHNTWKPLPLDVDNKRMGFARPYGQMVYSVKYGVFVNMGKASRGVAVMRPDVSKIGWKD
jgi:hypothetical protein